MRSYILLGGLIAISFLSGSQAWGQTLFEWDFDISRPFYDYSFGYAGQTAVDCEEVIIDNADIVAEHDAFTEDAAYGLMDVSDWVVADDACNTWAGWGLGLGHILDGQQVLTSNDFSEYRLTFDAWVEGLRPLASQVEVVFMDSSSTTRMWAMNNQDGSDADLPPILVTEESQTFSFTLEELGMAEGFEQPSLGDASSVTGLNVAIIPGAVAEDFVEFDANNYIYLDNVKLEAPFDAVIECDPFTDGDLDGNGTVEFADFVVLSANFGQAVSDHTKGDIDCNGTVEFADFLVFSDNFGQPIVAETTSVPEPTSFGLSWLVWLVLGFLRGRR